ncbi:Cyclic-AMP phosphodiesterase class-II [Penicillium paradoxum]|uniref:Cyclic-AMP phosphodiesterase class-II n=1 Tax=Penicillium paradoxum TaxID=176176 RepID=UPI002547D23A|nr:Cyclic-AMP phosphodiesterase class-II [Penicillium paradoxum]KAJ5774903.1 Cyclic-AMP phosphodiesterase class-II [Penicillium paradoxum]
MNRLRSKASKPREDPSETATFQVIVLGPTGGPREDNVTGILVRATSTKWSSNSVVAVDAGTLLAGIVRLLEDHMPKCQTEGDIVTSGPLQGLELPYETPEANAAHVFRELIGAVLITHPHLDHVSGLVINTPILEAGNEPKPVAALPSVLTALKNHIFNDIIWPNLSDEDGGAGLLTYQRLVEGGNPRFGRGDSRGYVRACSGLSTKCLKLSHGRCKQRYHAESGTHHRIGSMVFADHQFVPSRSLSVDHREAAFYSPSQSSRSMATSIKDSPMATVESSAFFLRDHRSGSEIIVFGDLEPDSVSGETHNRRVWEAAAPKIASGSLQAIFIECSYNDSTDDAYLYGHMCPRHLVAELTVLASKVMEVRGLCQDKRKRKRVSSASGGFASAQVSPRSRRWQSSSTDQGRRSDSSIEPRSHPNDGFEVPRIPGDEFEDLDPPDPETWASASPLPLTGLQVHIIHIKEALTDGPHPREQILRELQAHSEAAHLGCEFFAPTPGKDVYI